MFPGLEILMNPYFSVVACVLGVGGTLTYKIWGLLN